MKSVLISIRPEWCDKIASGKKTIEIRKSKPKLELPFKCYIYCTKQKEKIICNGISYYNDELYRLPNGEIKYGCSIELAGYNSDDYSNNNFLNGKVIGEFICDCIEYMDLDSVGIGFWKNNSFNYIADLGWNTGLTRGEFINYTEGKWVYGWHISDVVIYDKPKELNSFYCRKLLTRPPQSWCYVEEVSE